MQGDELLEIALRVLSACVARERPDPADVAVLRRAAGGPEPHLAADSLAVQVIRRELQKRKPGGPGDA